MVVSPDVSKDPSWCWNGIGPVSSSGRRGFHGAGWLPRRVDLVRNGAHGRDLEMVEHLLCLADELRGRVGASEVHADKNVVMRLQPVDGVVAGRLFCFWSSHVGRRQV